MRRELLSELFDEDLGTPAELTSSLSDLRLINQLFGGTRTTVNLLKRVLAEGGGRELSLLEVGAAAGDLPLSAQRLLAGTGTALRVVLLDRMWSHLNSCSAVAVCGDGLQLPFRDSVFDVVSCALFAHHLEPEELRHFVLEGLRVCRRALLINDLIRSWLHLWLVYAGLPLFRSRLTRHDAPASVRRAYTLEEIRRMLQDLPGVRIEISKHYLYRVGVLVWKNGS